MSRYMLVASARDEAASILEWVAHHRLAGFDPIFVYQNDSTDLTVPTLRALDRIGAIRFVNNSRPHPAQQVRAYRRAAQTDDYARAEWCLALDLDEFLCVKTGAGTVGDLIAALPESDAVALNWKNFGSGGEAGLTRDLTTERFSRTMGEDEYREAYHGYKTLFRTEKFARAGVHQPRGPKDGGIRRINGSGMPEGTYREVNWRSQDPENCRLAQVNHYPIKDVVSFINKRLRGNAHRRERVVGLDYWMLFDRNDGEDRILADRAPALRAEMERLDRASGGELSALRTRSFRIMRQRFLAALSDPEVKALYDALAERCAALKVA